MARVIAGKEASMDPEPIDGSKGGGEVMLLRITTRCDASWACASMPRARWVNWALLVSAVVVFIST